MSAVQINPQKVVGYLQGHLSFSAVGLDIPGKLAHGAKFDWSSSDTEKLRIDETGQATLIGSGLVWVTARTQFGVSGRAPVLIRPRTRPVQTDDEWQVDQDDLKPDGTTSATRGGVGALLDSLVQGLAPTALAQSSGGDSADLPYDELWSEPRNLVGSPRNRVMDASVIGAVLPEGSNFEFGVPIDSMPGRGLPLGLGLSYNSRIWSRHSSAVTFNAVNTWPYIGFTLSFGRIVTYASGSNTKFVLIDSDGTRHYLGSGPGGTTTTYQTNDGSHIIYVGTATGGGTLYYNSGVSKTVGYWNNRLLVTQMTDPNGNYISIAYATQSTPCTDNSGKVGYIWHQAISSVTDTLGRVFAFNYDCFNYLTSISGPDLNGATATLVQFDYQMATISSSFSGLTIENLPTGPVAELSHIYFPATQTGYKFSSSAYGMIYNASMRTGMSIDSYGVISDGTEKGYVNFNYPTTASSLTDAPSFSQRTEYPAATAGGTAPYSYSSSSGTGTKIFTITRPDYSTVNLTRSDATGTDFGLLTQTEVKNSGGTSMSKSVMAYANDGGSQPQVASVIGYDDAANQTKVDFDYDSYGNVTNTRQYGFQVSGQFKVRRRNHTVYKTDSSYLNAYLRNLVTESDVYSDVYDANLDTNDANDILLAKSTFTFDDYTAMSGMENYAGGASPPNHDSSYDTTKTVRGNCTGQTVYSDVSAPTSTTWLMKLDIFGNVTQRQVACCNVQTTTFGGTNDYALAESVTKGASGGPQVTSSATYDFDTSTSSTATDPNGLVKTVTTRDAKLRPTLITYLTGAFSSGATASASHDDSTPSGSETVTYSDGGTQKTVTGSTVYDNWGRVIQQVDANGTQVNTAYDVMGRVASVTNPFPSGGTPGALTTYTYDAIGRVTVVTLPDSQTVQTSYSGHSVTVTDQVNRKIQRITDGLGRLMTVNEQDALGSLSQATSYTYNYLDKLIEINQGGQYRRFKYDAIGRLLYEKIPEQTPTINDGTGTYWTCKYIYTPFDAVYQKTDARGVVSTFTYDGLNRVTQESYSTVSGVTTAPTVSYVYDYDSTYGTTADGMLVRVNVGSDYQERYTFDASFQVASTICTIGSRTYTTGYSRNQANQPTQLTYPSSRTINMSHDSIGRLSGMSEPSNGPVWLSSVTYNGIGQVTADALGNGVTEQYGYDSNRMQLTSQKAGTSSPYTNRMDLTYGYSASAGQMGAGSTAGNAGQLMSVSSTSTIGGSTESAAYTYDNVGRLVTSNQISNSASAQRRFAYDRWGNRTTMWDTTSGGNELQSIALEQSGGAPTNHIQSVTPRNNVALASNGATASASSSYSTSYPASAVINGDRKGTNWGSGGGWKDGTASSYPDWVQVSFHASKTINEIDVFTLQDNSSSPSEPTEDMTFTTSGILDFQVQYWNGSSWQTVSGGSITGNNKVWNKFTFSNITTDMIRVYVTSASGGYSPVVEVEAYKPGSATSYAYDSAGAGNLINDGVHSYGYDSENRIVSVDSGSTATYAYDHQNRRYKTTVGSAVTHYVWQASQVLAEHNGSTGAVITDYVFSGRRMIGKVSGSAQYFLSDRLSTRLVMDTSGNVSGRQGHLPFGEDFGESGTQQKQHFTSYERDSESGTDYAVNRQYSQSTGRLLRPDPNRESYDSNNSQSLSRYVYTENDPVNNIDPSGLDASGLDDCDITFHVDGRTFFTYDMQERGPYLGQHVDGPDLIFVLEVVIQCHSPQNFRVAILVQNSELMTWLNADTGRQALTNPDIPDEFDVPASHFVSFPGDAPSAGAYMPFSFRMKRNFGFKKGVLFPNGGYRRWIISVAVSNEFGTEHFGEVGVLTLVIFSYRNGMYRFKLRED